MKHSIKHIFKNLQLLMSLAILVAIILFIFLFEQNISYKKVEELQNQKHIAQQMMQKLKAQSYLDPIGFNSEVAQLTSKYDQLQHYRQYSYITMYLLGNETEASKQLNTLQEIIEKFRKSGLKHIKPNNYKTDIDEIDKNNLLLITHIDDMIIKNIGYDSQRFAFFFKIAVLMLIIMIFTLLWYKKRLSHIYDDIFFLYSIDSGKKNRNLFSIEMDAILLRMKRKLQVSDNPSMVDSITGISNYKGMVQASLEKKTSKENMFASVTVFEIDNFSKSKQTYHQEFTQEILKKVAYTISLHEMAADIIARTDYNQFTLLFFRANKEQLFKDVDLVRQSISELTMVSPDKEKITLSVTGGFVYKNPNAPLDVSIREAIELLKKAQQIGKNKLLQKKDIPK